MSNMGPQRMNKEQGRTAGLGVHTLGNGHGQLWEEVIFELRPPKQKGTSFC